MQLGIAQITLLIEGSRICETKRIKNDPRYDATTASLILREVNSAYANALQRIFNHADEMERDEK